MVRDIKRKTDPGTSCFTSRHSSRRSSPNHLPSSSCDDAYNAHIKSRDRSGARNGSHQKGVKYR
eukprot:scaffold6413_cov334-Pinguiococcus_pyrenoidosus.AAC.1